MALSLNFNWLSEALTARTLPLRGFLPPLKSIVMLLLMSAALATGAWLWAGIFSYSVAFVPLLGEALGGVLILGTLNFLFSREINRLLLAVREFLPGKPEQLGQNVDMRNEEGKLVKVHLPDMVRSLVAEINAYYADEHDNYDLDLHTTDEALIEVEGNSEREILQRERLKHRGIQPGSLIRDNRGDTWVYGIGIDRQLKLKRLNANIINEELGNIFQPGRKLQAHQIPKSIYRHIRYHQGHLPNDMPMPRVGCFTDNPQIPRIVTVPGHCYEESALYFSMSMVEPSKTHLTTEEFAALVRVELMKIYQRRGYSSTLFVMIEDFLTTLKNANTFNSAFQIANWIVAPLLQFVLLVPYSVWRSHSLEAMTPVLENGHGLHLIRAIYQMVYPGQNFDSILLPTEVARIKNNLRREPYTGFGARLIRPITDWIDRHQWLTDIKPINRLKALLNIMIADGGTVINEMRAKDPRSTTKLLHAFKVTGYDRFETKEELRDFQTRERLISYGMYKQIHPKIRDNSTFDPNITSNDIRRYYR